MLRAFLFLLTACGADPTDSGEPVSPSDCADIPPVNYTNFGQGFLTESCQGCHASTAPNRFGAPESVVFDTVEQAWSWRAVILSVVIEGGAPPMPPAGGLNEADLQRLEWWFACAEEGT